MTTRVDETDPAVLALREARAVEAAQRASELLQKVRQLRLRELERGAIIRFSKQFNGEQVYEYAALKCGVGAGARWFVTNTQRGLKDDELEELLVTDNGFFRYELVSHGLAEGNDE